MHKTEQRLVLPFYHLVSDETPKHVQHLYTARSIERFKEDLDLAKQLTQTRESIETIRLQFNLDYSVFSFPFTDDGVTQQIFNKIAEFTDLTFGCAGIKEDSAKNHLQRIPMETNQTGKEIIKSEYLYCLLKQKAGKNKIIRQ